MRVPSDTVPRLGESIGAAGRGQHHQPDQDGDEAELGHHGVEQSGGTHLSAGVVGEHQDQRRERHQLPGEQKGRHRSRRGDQQHRGHEQRQHRQRDGAQVLAARVTDGVDPDGDRDRGGQRHEEPAQRIHLELYPGQWEQPADAYGPQRSEDRRQSDPYPDNAERDRRGPRKNRPESIAGQRGCCGRRGRPGWRSPAGHRSQCGDDVGGCRRAARDLEIDGHHVVTAPDDTVSLGEHAAIQCAVTARDHHPRLRGRRHRISQRFGHVARHHAGDQQRVGMPRVRPPAVPRIARRRRPVRTRRRSPPRSRCTNRRRHAESAVTPARPRRRRSPASGAASARSTTRPVRRIFVSQPIATAPPGRQRGDPREPQRGRRARWSTLCGPPRAIQRCPEKRSSRSPRCPLCARRQRPRASSTPNCWDRFEASRPTSGNNSPTDRSWLARSSRIRTRAGWPSVLKNSPLSL